VELHYRENTPHVDRLGRPADLYILGTPDNRPLFQPGLLVQRLPAEAVVRRLSLSGQPAELV
jgi:hypothetical protein